MNTHEVPPSDWNEFLRSFSRRYENWLVQLETIEMSGHLLSSRQLRLKSIAAETEGTTKTILLQGKATDTANTISDLIRNPAKVTVTETAEGLTESLQITTPTNTVRIQFRSAAVLPEPRVPGHAGSVSDATGEEDRSPGADRCSVSSCTT